jgi:hypothetical protein
MYLLLSFEDGSNEPLFVLSFICFFTLHIQKCFKMHIHMLSSSSRMPDTHRREAPSSTLAAYPASLCPKFLVFSPPLRNWRGGGGASGPPCPERSGRLSWRKSRIFEPFNFPVASTRPLRLRFCVCGIPLIRLSPSSPIERKSQRGKVHYSL